MSSQTEMRLPIQILLACAILVLVSCGKSEQQLAEERFQAETTRIVMETRKANEASVADAAKKALEDKQRKYLQLLIPDDSERSSAQFRNLRFVTGTSGEALCGEASFINRNGGHTEFWPFVVTERPMKSRLPKDLLAEFKVKEFGSEGRAYLFWSRDGDPTLSKDARARFADEGCI